MTVPALFVPAIGQVVGVVALASAGGAALIDTSLAVGHARDEHGRSFVTGADLTMAWATIGLAAFGVGAAAGASAAARGAETTFTKEVTHQFTRETFAEAGANVRRLGQLKEELGAAGARKWMKHIASKHLKSMGPWQQAFSGIGAGGVVLGPAVVSGNPTNVLGLRDMIKIGKIDALSKDLFLDLHPGPPDLHAVSPPVIRAIETEAQFRSVEPPPKPVMGE